jgi:hypothetical protein
VSNVVNTVGDLVLTDPEAMRALADPARLALHDRLRREGPATAEELGADEAQLEELEHHGLVARSADGWSAVGKGFVFEIPEDPDGQEAARQLSNTMLLSYAELPGRWVADDEPRLDLDWVRASGLFNARVAITPDELRGVQERLEELLEPFITRTAVPEEAAPVRILAYFLPEAADDFSTAGGS